MEANIQLQFDEINSKLSFIIDELEQQRRQRVMYDDLMDDLMRVAKDVYRTATDELEELSAHVEFDDFRYLIKKLIRNTGNLTQLLEQVESIRDFTNDAKRIVQELFGSAIIRLDELERAGYFQFFKESTKIADNIVNSFSAEDVKKLGDNIVAILNTVKNLTQPEMLTTVNNAVDVYKSIDINQIEKMSIFSLLKELNKPEMKQGIVFMTKFVKSLSEHK